MLSGRRCATAAGEGAVPQPTSVREVADLIVSDNIHTDGMTDNGSRPAAELRAERKAPGGIADVIAA
jgi:hypothetical protein